VTLFYFKSFSSMSKISALVLLLITCLTVNAQINSMSKESTTQLDIRLFSEDAYDPGYEGSPYVTESYIPAHVNDQDKVYKVRYNAERDHFEVKLSETRTIVLDNLKQPYTIKLVGLDKVYETVKFENGDTGYAIPVWKGNDGNALYRREMVTYEPPRDAVNGYQSDEPAKFTREKDTYFFTSTAGENLKEVPSRRGKLYDLFPKKDAKAYIKKNDLDIKEEGDLIKIFKHFM